MSDDEMKSKHPDWYIATDYKWLKVHSPQAYSPNQANTANRNRLDDFNRRNIGNWSYNDFTQD